MAKGGNRYRRAAYSLLALLALIPLASANVYNVTGTADGAGVVTPLGGGNFNASTLRGAANAANAVAGLHTINVPSGTYTLTLGEIQVGTNANQTLTINGTGTPANTLIQHDTATAAARVFNLDPNLLGGVNVTIQNVSIAHGRNNDGIGGAGIICGYQGPPAADTTTLSNCVLLDNLVVTNTPDAVGGGLQNIGGTLRVLGCRFDSNSSSNFSGGAIYYDSHSPSTGTFQIVNCTFTNNASADSSSGGGALFVSAVTNSSLTLSNSLFTGNKVTSTNGSGGAIIKFGGAPLIISGCTFTNNLVLGTSSTINNASGGAVDNGGGPMTIVYSRFYKNTAAVSGHGNAVNVASASGATLTGDNNWWGTNSGPGLDLAGASVSTWLKLNYYATPSTVAPGNSATLTATVLTNSAGAAIPVANLGVLIGLPITFGNAVGGTISSPQATIQASGNAAATYTINGTPGAHTADATVDSATATANMTLLCPAITATVSGGATNCPGNPATVTVTLSGGVSPYVVTLNNGGGTKTNASPVVFTVNPVSTTTYSVTSAFDANGCPATPSDSATATVNAASSTISPNPVSVCPNSAGNQASGPAGMTRYAWTISNGTITSATNLATITYTAGASGSVTLGLTVTNSTGCGATSFLGVPINTPPSPTIVATPPSVIANSPGNQASGPSGLAGYAWTIANGTITGPANGPSVTYIAGPFGNVTLGLTVTDSSGCTGGTSLNVTIIPGAMSLAGASFRTNYFASMTFTDALGSTTMPISYDGSNYWSCSGGGSAGVRLARYDSNGVMLATYSPGLDFRSVFSDGAGVVLARAFLDRTIYIQTAPGVFAASGVVLNGGTLDSQSCVVLNGAGTEYLAASAGTVSRWDPAGNYLGSVALQGYGSLAGETNSPANRGIAAFGDFWLTYNGARLVSVWDTIGNRLAVLTLTAAGTNGIDPSYSFSYANGKAFVVDIAGGLWRGYDVGSPGRVGVFGSPNLAAWNTDVQNKVVGTGQIPQVDASLVNLGYPVPTLAQLRRYESVLVYSDQPFNDNVAIGNNLADYVDLGGGVVLNTFVFYSLGGLSMQGRLVTGSYLPFTTGGQSSSNGITLVKDQPAHPIFTGVSSLNAGTAGFYNTPISIAPGATLLGHWVNGQPLVGIKDMGPGRTTGLNFYPPSSDAAGGFWLSSTDGGRLMANALLYAGKVPPVIVMPASNKVVSAGGNVSFAATAVGLPPMTYQWRKNATNIPGATTNTLTFPMLTNSSGIYTLVVSNSYGIAVSSKALLNLPLRIWPPVTGPGGAFPLLIGASDGTPLTADRASRIRLYGCTNVALPLTGWTQVATPLVFSNGFIRADGITANHARQFYRAAETP